MNIHKKKIIILGDSMIDRYYYSKMDRISPEAPIPIHSIQCIKDSLGGASNVALNLTNLFQNEKDIIIEFITISGKDEDSKKMTMMLKEKNISYHLYSEEGRKTIIKNRIYVNDFMTTRFDIESTETIQQENVKKIYDYLYVNRNQILYIIFSDYQKGMLSPLLTDSILRLSEEMNIFVFVDPKVKDIEKYQNTFLLKPNLIEANQIAYDAENIDDMLVHIYKKTNCKNLLVTCGSEGMILYTYPEKIIFKHSHLPSMTVKDVTGAGDAVFSSLIYSFYKYNNLIKSVEISNYIGYLSVQTMGTYICDPNIIDNYANSLIHQIKKPLFDSKKNKIFHFVQTKPNTILQHYLTKIKENYKKIVFTNGCFDILHPGHIELLQYSKSEGDFLIVAMNSDSSIKTLKGENRPIHSQEYRTYFLSLFDFVDMIIVFYQQTPFELLESIKPHILVKGGDYTKESIIGKEWVNEVKIFPLIKDNNNHTYSTTSIIEKLNK